MRNKDKVPFTPGGQMLMSAKYHKPSGVVYHKPTPFFATLTFQKFDFGTSARRVRMEDKVTGLSYSMQLREWQQHIPLLVEGTLTGKFGFKKMGQYWHLSFLSVSPLELLGMQSE